MKKHTRRFLISLLLLFVAAIAQADYKILIDHTTTNLDMIPASAIVQAKTDLHISYQHTSHGSQLITGMNALRNFPAFGTTYQWSDNGSVGLDLDDYGIPGCADLSQGDTIDPDYGVTPWVVATRSLLDNPANSHVNVIVWSWCSISGRNAQRYVDHMEILISEYGVGGSKVSPTRPPVEFVFMTGHAQGQGEDLSPNSVHYNNELIRAHCFNNNRVLFDFADIEAYNPGNPNAPLDPGYEYFWDLAMQDNLNYTGGNWAAEWIALYPTSELAQLTTGDGVDGYSGCSGCAHSDSPADANLNCVLKGRAAWWLWAKLAGWEACTPPAAPSDMSGTLSGSDIVLTWTDNSANEDNFILQRSFDGGAWDTDFQTLPANTVTYTDSGLSPGTYSYRVMAYDTSENCYSSLSNGDSVEVISTDPPGSPVLSTISPDWPAQTITITWADVANETGYTVQRQVDGGAWDTSFDTAVQNAVSYTDVGLAPGTYTYRITADNTYGSSVVSNTLSADMVVVPAAPSALSATADNVNFRVDLAWTDNADNETGFRIQRQVNAGTWDNAYDAVLANTTAYTDDNQGGGPLPTGTYNYRVVAYLDSTESSPSNANSAEIVTLIPSAPSNLVSTLSGTDIDLTWADNSANEANYVIERQIGSGSFAQLVSLAADTTAYSDTGLTPYQTYTYRVKAVNAHGDSLYSNETAKEVVPVTTTVMLQGTAEVEDAFLDAAAPDTNYGALNYTTGIIYGSKHYVTKFNLPVELIGKRIIEAKLGIYGWGISNYSPGQYIDFYNVTTVWDDGTVTWNTPWTSAGGDYGDLLARSALTDVDHVYFPEADLTSTVAAWVSGTLPNNGVILINQTTTSIGLKAAEYESGSSTSTYLSIIYAEPVPGDVNHDYLLDLKDVESSLRVLTACCATVDDTLGDINEDQKIGSAEAQQILRQLPE